MSLEVTAAPPAHCTLLREFTWELTWRPEQHIYPGMEMELRCHKLRSFHTWTVTRAEVDPGDITFRCQINPTVSQRRLNPHRVLVRAVFRYGVTQGEPVRIRLTARPGMWLGVDPILSVWTTEIPNNFNPDAELPPPAQEAGSECRLVAGPSVVERLSVYSRPMPDAAGEVRTLLVPEDRFGNPSRFASPVPVLLRWNDEEEPVDVHETTEVRLPAPKGAVGRAVARVPLAALDREETIANGVPDGDGRAVTGNPVWPEPVDGRRPVFGEFHWHTDFSGDGQRPIAEAVRCARDALNLDYVSPGDHNPHGAAWAQTVAALEEANEPGRFVTFFGWENGADRGHENYYFTRPDHPLICGGAAGIRGGRPPQLVDALRGLWEEAPDFVAIPHHTNAVAETRKVEDDSPFWHPYPWGSPEPYIRLVEIMQVRGNQERNDYTDAWRGWHQNHQASVQDALGRGYRVGFTGGTDNHCGWPGRAFSEVENAFSCAPKSVILTGLWAEEHARDAVFRSLWERRSWAVWDTRALVDWRVNGVPAGGELTVKPGETLTGTLRLSAEDALRVLEVVSEGEAVHSAMSASADVELSIPLGTAERSTHFYLRALEHKGGLIYASPVFVDVNG